MDLKTVTAVFALLALGYSALVEDDSSVIPDNIISRHISEHHIHISHTRQISHTRHIAEHHDSQTQSQIHPKIHTKIITSREKRTARRTLRAKKKATRKARRARRKAAKQALRHTHSHSHSHSHTETHTESHTIIHQATTKPALIPLPVTSTSPPTPTTRPAVVANTSPPTPTTRPVVANTSPPIPPTLPTVCVNQPDESCAHKDIKFEGAGILLVKGLSGHKVGVTDCAKVCNLTPNCKAITFDETSGECTLLATYGGEKLVQKPSWTSLNMDCKREAVIDTSCALKDTDFGGMLQEYKNVASLDECAKICLASELCKAVSYMTDTKDCVTKDSIGGSELKHKDKSISLNMDCTRHRYLDEGCSHVGMNIPGTPISHNPVRAITLRMCADQCVSEPACEAIVHQKVGAAETCTLLAGFDFSLEKGTYNPSSRGVTSLNVHCKREETLFDIWCCKHPNTLFNGPNRAHLTGVKEEECVRMCLADKGCKAASYNTKTTDCFFKDKTNGDGLDTGADAKGIISFNMEGDCAKKNTA